MHRWRFTTFGLVLALLALAVLPAGAQEAAWTVYVYNGFSKELLGINSDGTMQPVSLGLGENEFVGSFDMAFSDDGARAAFCILNPNGALGAATFVLRDLVAGSDLLRQSFDGVIGCRVGHEGLNEDGSQVAVALVNNFPPAEGQPVWRILLLDMATGATVSELDSAAAQRAGLSGVLAQLGGPSLPYVQRFAAGEVIFADVPYGVGGGAEWQAFRWTPATGALEAAPPWGNIGLASLPATGEIAHVAADTLLPAAAPVGPFPPLNIVRLYETGSEPRVLYHNPEKSVLGVDFVSDGQELAILLVDAFDVSQPAAASLQTWLALDRSGMIRELIGGAPFIQLMGAPGGFVALSQTFADPATGAQQFTLVYGAGGETRAVWASAQGLDQAWELAWVTPFTPAAGLPPFPMG